MEAAALREVLLESLAAGEIVLLDDLLSMRAPLAGRVMPIDADEVPSRGLSAGLLDFPPGASLRPHRHAPPEIYLVWEGEGAVLVGDETRSVRRGSVVFVPPECRHGMTNVGSTHLSLVWVFPTDTWREVDYRFEDDRFEDGRLEEGRSERGR